MRKCRYLCTLATVAFQLVAPAVGVAHVCWPGEHTHNGAAAPDCQMHHEAVGHAGHGATHSHSDALNTDAAVSCRCSSLQSPATLGEPRILTARSVLAPPIDESELGLAPQPAISDLVLAPTPPPPRPSVTLS